MYCDNAFTAGENNPVLKAERLAPVTIEPSNNYSENTRLRISVVYPPGHSHSGQAVQGLNGQVLVEEWRTEIYDGKFGATRLPMNVSLKDGSVQVELKSLARFSVYDARNAPLPQIAVHYGKQRVLVDVPQWLDEDGNDKTDWLEARVEDILARARKSNVTEVTSVVSALGGWKESYKRDCGGFMEEEPHVTSISSVCIDWDGVNAHRLNDRQQLTATILHEIRHVWVHYRPMLTSYKLKLLYAPSGRKERHGCAVPRKDGEMCSVHIRDERYAAQEADAEMFANKYKDLFP